MIHVDHPCAVCGVPGAPYGYRLPGLLSALPAGRRSYLWVCRDHRAEAEARQAAAARQGLPPMAPKQGELFGV